MLRPGSASCGCSFFFLNDIDTLTLRTMANYILPFTTGGAGSINSVFLTGKNSNIMAIDNCEIGLRPGKEYLWKPGGGKGWNNGWTWPARVLVQGSFSFMLSRRAATTGIQFWGGCLVAVLSPILTLDIIFGWDGNLRRQVFRGSCYQFQIRMGMLGETQCKASP